MMIPTAGRGCMGTWREVLVFGLLLLLGGARAARACSPAGHAFVAIASLRKLEQSEDPEARKLAAILWKYRWVVYWGAEGPDVVQQGRGYHNSHWFPLYSVDYHHPEQFDLKAAEPYYTALLKHAYAADYGVTADDAGTHGLALVRLPQKDWNEVGVAYACGYITHLISDYFCHDPAKVWWDQEPKLREAVQEVCSSTSYGVIQEFYAVMLWERFLMDYGMAEDAQTDFRRRLPECHVDNGVLPYCALACSRRYYADWPANVLEAVDPSKYDVCAAPMLGKGGAGFGRCVEHESGRVHAMLDHMGISLDEAVRQSDDLTGWRDTYARVIGMIVQLWTAAAPRLDLVEPDHVDVIQAAKQGPSQQGMLITVPREQGARVNLALYLDQAVLRYSTRSGEQGPVTGWGEKPSGARFDLGFVAVQGANKIAILTDGPWLGDPGYVSGTFRLKLPKTDGKLGFRSLYGMHGKETKSDGVTFRVIVTDAGGQEHELFETHTNSRELKSATVDLSQFAGQEVELALISDAGPNDNPGWDWGAWVEPLVVTEPKL